MTDTHRGTAATTAWTWGALLAVVSVASIALNEESTRRQALRLVLLLMAGGEGVGAFMQIFRARHMSALTGRPYDAAYHGVVQDFGLYNWAMAILLVLCAIDPARNAVVLWGAMALYAVHGGTHVLRYLGFYYGGETSFPTRPRHFELRDGLPLLVALAALALFYPRG